MSQRNVIFLASVVYMFSLVGCISGAEKQARSENAYDVSGEYSANKTSGSQTDMKINIRNKSSRTDIGVVVTRLSGMEKQEEAFLKSQGVDSAAVSSYFGSTLTMDSGDKYNLSGGTNHSDDFGASDTFSICTNDYNFNATKSVRYCLNGTVKKNDFVMRGSLTLYITTKSESTDRDGKKYQTYSTNNTDLSYNTAMNKTYFEQYFGIWSGPINQRLFGPNSDFRGVETLSIQKSGEMFIVQPAIKTIVVDGVTYTYAPTSQRMDQTKDMSVPLVEVLYQGPNGDRVVLFCQMYSMGKMTGSAVLIKGNDQYQFASFALVHQ
jgi:hypothetical protein